jgi:hypothetical protein
VIFGPDIVKEAKAIVHRIQDNLKAEKSHQETYANKEASALKIWSQRSCVLEGLAIERSEEVWGKMKVSSSLYRTIPHPQEVLDCGVQAWPATILSWRSQHLPRVAIEEMFEGTHGRHVAWSDTARGWLIVLGHPIKILDQKDRVTRYKTIKFFKIQWRNHTEEEASWESEDFLRSLHSDFALP